jgi:hypothetical protein
MRKPEDAPCRGYKGHTVRREVPTAHYVTIAYTSRLFLFIVCGHTAELLNVAGLRVPLCVVFHNRLIVYIFLISSSFIFLLISYLRPVTCFSSSCLLYLLLLPSFLIFSYFIIPFLTYYTPPLRPHFFPPLHYIFLIFLFPCHHHLLSSSEFYPKRGSRSR